MEHLSVHSNDFMFHILLRTFLISFSLRTTSALLRIAAMMDDDLSALDGVEEDTRPPSSRSAASTAGRKKRKFTSGSTPYCIMPRCDEEKKKGQRFCNHQWRHYDNMRAQAVAAEAAGSKDQKKIFVEMMSDDEAAIQEIDRFAEENIASGAWKKKKKIDWAEWNERRGVKTSTTDTNRAKPFEREEYIIRQVNKFGRSKGDALNLWNEAVAASHARDHLGFKGQLRLWLQHSVFKDVSTENYIDKSAVEGSSRIKNPNQEVREALRRHTHESKASVSDGYFSGGSGLLIPGSREKADDERKQDDSGAEEDEGGSKKKNPQQCLTLESADEAGDSDPDAEHKGKTRKIDFASARTTFYSQASKALEKQRATIEGKLSLAVEAFDQGRPAPDGEAKADKLVREAYIKRLESCKAVGDAWISKDASLKAVQTVPAAASGGTASSAPTSPHFALWAALGAVQKDLLCVSVPAHFRPHLFMQEFLDSILAAGEIRTLDSAKRRWARMTSSSQEFITSLTSSCRDLSKHVTLQATAIQREAKKEAQQNDKDALAKQRAQLGARAASLKQKSGKPADLPPFFKAANIKTTPMKRIDANSLPVGASLDAPCLLKTPTAVAEWSANSAVQQVMAQWGAKYKKSERFDVEKRAVGVLKPKCGKEQTDKLFADLLIHHAKDIVDISEVNPQFMTTSWSFGYAPDFHSCGFNPNSAACIRVLLFGTVEVFAVSLGKLLAACKASQVTMSEPATATGIKDFMLNLGAESINKLAEAGAEIHHAEHKAEEVLYIPTGWVVVERSKNGLLLYGVRKSFFFKGAAAADNYNIARQTLVDEGRNADRMAAVAKLLSS